MDVKGRLKVIPRFLTLQRFGAPNPCFGAPNPCVVKESTVISLLALLRQYIFLDN